MVTKGGLAGGTGAGAGAGVGAGAEVDPRRRRRSRSGTEPWPGYWNFGRKGKVETIGGQQVRQY